MLCLRFVVSLTTQAVYLLGSSLLPSCRRTIIESSSGNHFGHIGHAAAYAERYRRSIEYNWKVREARIVKNRFVDSPFKTSQSLELARHSFALLRRYCIHDRPYEISIDAGIPGWRCQVVPSGC